MPTRFDTMEMEEPSGRYTSRSPITTIAVLVIIPLALAGAYATILLLV